MADYLSSLANSTKSSLFLTYVRNKVDLKLLACKDAGYHTPELFFGRQ